jgi:hypothetical protein
MIKIKDFIENKSDKNPVTSSKVEAHRLKLVAPQYFDF